jgi:hypothetical protein
LAVAALASLGAVVSGVALTKGDLWGRGNFASHHRFVWPAFGLLMALAVWRLVVRDAMSRTGLYIYLTLILLASGLVAAAGYYLLPLDCIGVTLWARRKLEAKRPPAKTWSPPDAVFSFRAAPTAMVKTPMGARTHRAF